MSISDVIQLIAVVASTVVAIISICIANKTLKQNSESIELATRPYVVAYHQVLRIGEGRNNFYLIIRNFGQSAALITNISITPDFRLIKGRDYSPFRNIKNQTLAPGQILNTIFMYDANEEKQFTIKIDYTSEEKPYSDSYVINLDSTSDLLYSKTHTNGINKDTKEISDVLQEMLRFKL